MCRATSGLAVAPPGPVLRTPRRAARTSRASHPPTPPQPVASCHRSVTGTWPRLCGSLSAGHCRVMYVSSLDIMPTCLRCQIRRAATCFMRICHTCCAGTAATSASATPCTSAASPERAWPYAPSTRSPAGSSIWSSAAYSTMKCRLAASTLFACWWVSHGQQPDAGGGGTADAGRQTSFTVLID